MSKNESITFLLQLEKIIKHRKNNPTKDSYVSKIIKKGNDKILQKLGEECVEYIIDAKNESPERMKEEGADMMFHFIVSLVNNNLSITDIISELESRHLNQ